MKVVKPPAPVESVTVICGGTFDGRLILRHGDHDSYCIWDPKESSLYHPHSSSYYNWVALWSMAGGQDVTLLPLVPAKTQPSRGDEVRTGRVHQDVLGEAEGLRKLSRDIVKEHEGELWNALTPQFNAALYRAEADALERGYRIGRIQAAADVRLGLDQSAGNGGVHFDSDVEGPPEWLMRKAERLARGDA